MSASRPVIVLLVISSVIMCTEALVPVIGSASKKYFLLEKIESETEVLNNS